MINYISNIIINNLTNKSFTNQFLVYHFVILVITVILGVAVLLLNQYDYKYKWIFIILFIISAALNIIW